MTMESIDLPTISEETANAILDDTVQTAIQLRDEQGSDITMPTPEKLTHVFGPAAQLVAQMVMLSALRGFEVGFVEQSPASDRTDILVAALRRIHVPEMFEDCVEDGEHFPCKTARALDLVAGARPEAESLDLSA